MTTISMHVSEPWFSYIRSGDKKVEGKKVSEKWSSLKIGDTIKMWNTDNDYFLVEIVDIRYYLPTYSKENEGIYLLKKYLINEGLNAVLPSIKTVEEGVKVYLQYSTVEEISKYGMMAIEVKLL